MQTLSSAVTHLALGCAALCGLVGFALHGAEGAFLSALVGYFLGKTMQSLVWTFRGDYGT